MLRRRRLILWAVIAITALANLVTPFRVERLVIDLRAETVAHLGPWRITNTLLCSWLAMACLVVVGVLATRRLSDTPSALSLQNAVEMILEALMGFMRGFAGEHAAEFLPVVGTFFLFIIVANWLALLPGFGSIGLWVSEDGQRAFVPLLRGATTDLNTTLALAVCSVASSQAYGIRALGPLGYGSRFVAIRRLVGFVRGLISGERPKAALLAGGVLDLFIGILEIFEEITKVISFSFRLFGNVFGGEVLLGVMAFLVPYVASLPFLALEIFGGFIQALIFAVLSTAFYARAVSSHGSHSDDERCHSPDALSAGAGAGG